MTTPTDGIEVIVESLAAGDRYITAHGGTPRMGRCWAKNATSGGHFVVWPNTAGVTLNNMICPEHGAERHDLRQTVGGQVGRTVVATKAFVKSIADKANAAKAAKTAEAEAAGTTRKVRDLAVGDVFLYATKSYHAVELPTHAVVRVVAVTKLPKGRVELTVVGSAASYEAARGAYSRPYNLNGVERDLHVVPVAITGSISGTAQVITDPAGLDRRYYGHDELVAAAAGELRWADEVDVDAAELDRLSAVAKARVEYLAAREAELADLDAKLADPGHHFRNEVRGPAKSVEYATAELARRAAHIEQARADLAVIEARLDELAKAVSSPAIAEVEPIPDGPGEEDTWPAQVCGNCLGIAGERTSSGAELVVTFDEWSGRRLCQECEPAPMVDGIRAGQAVRIGPNAGANAGREAVVIRHEGTGTVVQILGQGIERLYHRSELTPVDTGVITCEPMPATDAEPVR